MRINYINTEFVLIPQGTRPISPRLKLVAENLVRDIIQEPGKHHAWMWIPVYKGIRIKGKTSYHAYNVCVAVGSEFNDADPRTTQIAPPGHSPHDA